MPRYSQNFLVNERIAEFIVEQAKVDAHDTVLEIGPGHGILTVHLLKKASVIAVEIDPVLCEDLKLIFPDELESGRLRLLCGDALRVRFPKFTKLVANIPYHISSPLLFKILEYEFKDGIIMVQKEFAERLTAGPGKKKYGRLSVMMYYRGRAELVKVVKRGNFRPIPRVDSAIVRIVREDRYCAEPMLLDEVVRLMFSQRRKKLKNILGEVSYADKRPGELTPEMICEVAKDVKNRLSY